MAIEIQGYDRHVVVGTFGSVQNLTQSTATIPQNVSLIHPVTTLGGGTATGISRDLYHLQASGTGTATDNSLGGPAAEGFRKTIYMLATGEAKLIIENWATVRTGIPEMGTGTATQLGIYTAASATGSLTFTLKGQYADLLYVNKQWHVLTGIATYATAT